MVCFRVIRNKWLVEFTHANVVLPLLFNRLTKNDGTVPQFYIDNNHEGIFSKYFFTLAQNKKARRNNLYSGKKKKKRLYQGKYALSGITMCGHRKDIFRRVTWQYKGEKTFVWRCDRKVRKTSDCPSRTLKEDELHQIIVIAINQFTEDKSMVLENLELILKNTLDSEYDKPIEDIEEKLHELRKELIGLHDDRRYNQIVDELEALRKLKQDILIENASREEKREQISDIKAFLKISHIEIEEYEEALVHRLVSKVIIHDEKVEVSLRTGEVITVNQ